MLFVSCDNQNESTMKTVSVDINDLKELSLSNGRVIKLQSNDSSLIFSISDIVKIKNCLYIQSRDMIKAFRDQDGMYIRDIGVRGNGPGEHTSISQIWENNENICFSDFNTNSAFTYDTNGKCINTITPLFDTSDRTHRASHFIVYPDSSCLIALNTLGNGSTPNPVASVLDLNRRLKNNIKGRDVLDSGHLSIRMAQDKENNRILYWEGFKDTIFAITTDSIAPIYAIDFGNTRYSNQNENDIFKTMRQFDEDVKAGARYTSIIQNIQKWKNLIFFVFTTDNNHFFYLGTINTDNNHVQTYHIDDAQYQQEPFIKILGDYLYIELSDKTNIEANPALFVIGADIFN